MENTLRKLGVVRKIALTTPSYNVVSAIITQTDYLSILPLGIARYAQQQHPILVKDVPVALPNLNISMFYHDDNQESRSHVWFRNCIVKAYQGAAGQERHPT